MHDLQLSVRDSRRLGSGNQGSFGLISTRPVAARSNMGMPSSAQIVQIVSRKITILNASGDATLSFILFDRRTFETFMFFISSLSLVLRTSMRSAS
jgi:hypothetical protein